MFVIFCGYRVQSTVAAFWCGQCGIHALATSILACYREDMDSFTQHDNEDEAIGQIARLVVEQVEESLSKTSHPQTPPASPPR